jgi:hypothetical protein
MTNSRFEIPFPTQKFAPAPASKKRNMQLSSHKTKSVYSSGGTGCGKSSGDRYGSVISGNSGSRCQRNIFEGSWIEGIGKLGSGKTAVKRR